MNFIIDYFLQSRDFDKLFNTSSNNWEYTHTNKLNCHNIKHFDRILSTIVSITYCCSCCCYEVEWSYINVCICQLSWYCTYSIRGTAVRFYSIRFDPAWLVLIAWNKILTNITITKYNPYTGHYMEEHKKYKYCCESKSYICACMLFKNFSSLFK